MRELAAFDEEVLLRAPGCTRLAGFDEAGRGALAGPVFVGCVHFPILTRDVLISLIGLDDSKRLTSRKREALLPLIKAHAAWGVGSAGPEEIDALGIVPAVSLAARRAYLKMGIAVDLLLCDRGLTLKDELVELEELELGELLHPLANEEATSALAHTRPLLGEIRDHEGSASDVGEEKRATSGTGKALSRRARAKACLGRPCPSGRSPPTPRRR